MSIPERLSAFVILVMLLFAACEGFGLGSFNPLGGGGEYATITGYVRAANDSSVIVNASVKLLYIDAQLTKTLGQDLTNSLGLYVIRWEKEWRWITSYYWNLEASADSFVTQRITPSDSNRVVYTRDTQHRNFYLQRISP